MKYTRGSQALRASNGRSDLVREQCLNPAVPGAMGNRPPTQNCIIEPKGKREEEVA